MNSDSDTNDCSVIESIMIPDRRWIESLGDKEQKLLEASLVPFEELEDRKVVCTSCFKQGNHKQKVRFTSNFHLKWIPLD
jgi:hypothetical protein